MSGLKGQIRTPNSDPRVRRNFDGISGAPEFVAAAEAIALTDAGALKIALAATPGLAVTAGLLGVMVQGVIDLDASGVKLTMGDGVANDGADALKIDLATDPGLEFSSAKLRVKIKAAGGVVRDSDGLSIDTGDLTPGGFTVTAIKIANYTAALSECVRVDPSHIDTTAPYTISLPTAVGCSGDQIIVKYIAGTINPTNACTVDPYSTQKMDSYSTIVLNQPYEVLWLISDGANWMIINNQ